MLIDIHSHLDHCYFKDDLDEVINNAKKSNVKVILTAGINPETNRKALELADKYDIVKPCLGIYPIQYDNNYDNTDINKKQYYNSFKKNKLNNNENLKNENNNSENENNNLKIKKDNSKSNLLNIDKEIKFIEKNKKKIVAIGEVGLDNYWVKDNSKQQKVIFEKMITLAEKLKKPIIVHSRKAEEDVIDMLQSSKLKKIIMHCFTGKKTLVKNIVDNGWFLTSPTCITRSTQFQDNVKLTPITQLFCETDAPYLSPYKEKRNEPIFIIESYKKIADIKKMELKEVINNIWMNWQSTFK